VILVVAATERELERIDGAVTLCTGIGPVEAGLATAFALTKEQPAAVLHIGIAGARTLQPPAVVIGSEAIYRDLAGLSADLPRTERVLPDATLLEAAKHALPEAHVLPICTSARVGAPTDCDVEAMEGFAVLRAAELSGVPALELRAISNAFDEWDRSRWRFDAAFEAVADAAKRLVAELS
jgi:predicted 5'-methylthioadenosine/S-adenosylhomocysteine nucleosidase